MKKKNGNKNIGEKTGKSVRENSGEKNAGTHLLRLDRFLALEGFGTRSEIRKAVRSGRASVNGAVEKNPGRQIAPDDEIRFDDQRIARAEFVYYMLYKPAGVITATEDSRTATVLDLLRTPESSGSPSERQPVQPSRSVQPVLRRDLFPVGRLDRDTEGLLLITDDGQLAHRLLSPGRHVDKVYYAVVTGQVTEEDRRRFAEGLCVDESLTAMPARLLSAAEAARETEQLSGLIPEDPQQLIPPGTTSFSPVLVTIREGKFHQIKRMFAAVGKEVLYLRRLSMGPLLLDEALSPGEFRELTQEEIRLLRET